MNAEIYRLEYRRRYLLAWLYAAPAGWPQPPVQAAMPVRAPSDISRFGVRNVLLTVGGAMLGVAALAFTVISWGSLGMGARALILLMLTAGMLGAAWPLTRRGLPATAETLAVVGLLLAALQCYAARAGGLLGLGAFDGAWYAAGSAAALTVGWTAYARFAPLRLPMPLAIVLAQLPPLLVVVALDVPPAGGVLVLLLLALANLGVREMTTGAERGTATLLGLIANATGTFAALLLIVVESPWAPALLVPAAGSSLIWAARLDRVIAVAGGLTLSASLALVLPLPDRWGAAGTALAAVIVIAGARLLPATLRGTAATGAALTFAGAVAWIVPGTATALGNPLALSLMDVSNSGSGRPFALWSTSAPELLPAAPIVLALLAGVLVLSRRSLAPPVVALAALTVLAHPALGVALAIALGVWAAVDRGARRAAAGTAVAVALWTVMASMNDQVALHLVLGAFTVAGAVYAYAVPAFRSPAVAFAILSLGGLAAAAGTAVDSPGLAAFAVLAAAAVGAIATWRVPSVPGEVALWSLALVAPAMAASSPGILSLALAGAGVLAFAVALRPDRRAAGWAGSVLLVAAWWVWLAALGVTVPEAYAGPVSVALLIVGLVRRTRRPAPSSWSAYGPALAATLLPSLLMAWTSAGPRPLLLVAGTLAITLLGAWTRLQAPLLIGGAVLLLAAGDLLAPLVTEFVTRLPGWAPVAVLGLVTLAVGATYERRLRDLRRLRDAVGALG